MIGLLIKCRLMCLFLIDDTSFGLQFSLKNLISLTLFYALIVGSFTPLIFWDYRLSNMVRSLFSNGGPKFLHVQDWTCML